MKASILALTCLLGLVVGSAASAQAPRTIVDEWSNVKAPPPPELKPVTVDPRRTALLILDLAQVQTCTRERRPRCVASLPRVAVLLTRALARGMPVIYSLAGGTTPADIWWQVKPVGAEPIVTARVDKFLGTDLERLLRERGTRLVIITGTSAQGAVLYTASAAVLRGFQVIVPLDGVSGDDLYTEQYAAWHLVNAPGGIGAQVTLTRTDLIQF